VSRLERFEWFVFSVVVGGGIAMGWALWNMKP
jgi:hypothetical protein